MTDSLGAQAINRTLQHVVDTFEALFPDRVRGYYVHGSVADGTSIATSDLDLDVVVKGAFRNDEEERSGMERAAMDLRAASGVELDIELTDEAALEQGAGPAFVLGSRPIHGEDIRDRVPLLPVEEWGRERMFRGYFLLVRVFDRPTPVRPPIGFPDADDEFFGYANRTVALPDGTGVPSTRNLVRVTGWLATALIAYAGGRYVVSKRDCHRLYGEIFGDEWAPLLEEIYGTCRVRWHSLIPEGAAERAQLREICRRTLGFENHFLSRVTPFMQTELELGSERARWLMHEIPLEIPS